MCWWVFRNVMYAYYYILGLGSMPYRGTLGWTQSWTRPFENGILQTLP